jgi:hypothetical protein
MVSRRTFLKGLAAAGAALVLPPTLTDNADAAKRFWALDSTHLSDPAIGMPTGQMGGRPPSPYDTIEVMSTSGIYPGMELRIYDMADTIVLPTFEQVRVIAVNRDHSLTVTRRL